MGLWSGIRISVRTLAKNRAFTIAAVLTVAIAIGSTTAIATIVDSILLRPLPYPDADRIVQVISYRQEGAATIRSASMARPFILGLSERSRSFADVGVFDSFSNITRRRLAMTLARQHGAAELHGTRISPVLFSMLGAQPQLGRLFASGDERPERNQLIVLSDRSWRAQYAGDPRVLGSSLTIDGRPYTLVGIMSPGFALPDAETDFWIPLTSAPVPPPPDPRSDSPNSAYADGVFARLREGVTIDASASPFGPLWVQPANRYCGHLRSMCGAGGGRRSSRYSPRLLDCSSDGPCRAARIFLASTRSPCTCPC